MITGLLNMITVALKAVNGIGDRKICYVCKRSFWSFTRFRGGSKNVPAFRKKLGIVGSDVDHFGCMYCGSHDRERHLYMFFDKLQFWDNMADARILHFAPEKQLQEGIAAQRPREYIKADIIPAQPDVREMDAQRIPFGDNAFDIVIANHLLEHVQHYRFVLAEFYRVLRRGGYAILQTPYSTVLKRNLEDPGISTDELRTLFYGQSDHVRLFAADELFQSITDAGFVLSLVKHNELFDPNTAVRYGVNSRECLLLARKP